MGGSKRKIRHGIAVVILANHIMKWLHFQIRHERGLKNWQEYCLKIVRLELQTATKGFSALNKETNQYENMPNGKFYISGYCLAVDLLVDYLFIAHFPNKSAKYSLFGSCTFD